MKSIIYIFTSAFDRCFLDEVNFFCFLMSQHELLFFPPAHGCMTVSLRLHQECLNIHRITQLKSNKRKSVVKLSNAICTLKLNIKSLPEADMIINQVAAGIICRNISEVKIPLIKLQPHHQMHNLKLKINNLSSRYCKGQLFASNFSVGSYQTVQPPFVRVLKNLIWGNLLIYQQQIAD